MAWADLLAGLAFYLVFEGLFPFASPQLWRRGLSALAGLPDNQLRLFGLAAVIAGLALLLGVRG
ncbi:MAG TPA: DUF2065 domain-containing protein [Gammaproteobacteria bacterium]|nr:DUF2065 domain-containing protein [Gammaproteobacteria bacterium]